MEKANFKQSIILTTAEELIQFKKEIIEEFKSYLEKDQQKINRTILPAKEAAKFFSVTERTLSKYADAGCFKKGYLGDKVYYNVQEIENYILQQKTDSNEQKL